MEEARSSCDALVNIVCEHDLAQVDDGGGSSELWLDQSGHALVIDYMNLKW